MGKRAIMVVLAMLVTGLVAPGVTGGAEPGLAGWWKFDGDALDSSGNERSGTLAGDAHYEPGLFGQAISLDGAGDFVNITGYKGVLGTGAFSVSLWVKTTGNGTMVNWGKNTNGQRVDLRVDQGRLRIEHGNGNLQAKTLMNDGLWHHVALTVAASASISYPSVIIYLDGKDDSQTTTDPDTFNIVASVDLTIGRRQTNADRGIAAMIDEVRLYDRVLTAAEVQTLGLCPRAISPDPADKAEGVSIPLLRWRPRQTAVWHDVYLGMNPELGPADLVSLHQTGTAYSHAAGLIPGTVYYWKVDEIEPDGTVYPGDTWSFTFASQQAWRPAPADDEPYTDPNLTLSWKPGLTGIYHDLYLGTDPAAVADGAADTFKGKLPVMSYTTGLLLPGTTYYWRVDEVNAVGGTVKGPVWTFTTLPVIPINDPNLVGWWTFDEGYGVRIVDWSGHGHHGQFGGTPTWVDGYDGMALSFDGSPSNEYVVMTGFPGVTGTHSRTATAWIKTATLGEILSWGLDVVGQKWIFRVQETDGVVGAIRVEVNGGHQVGWNDVCDNEWHHVAAVLDSDGTPDALEIKLYLDGVLEPSSAAVDEPINTVDTGVLRVGKAPWGSRAFAGLIDDVRMYDKALSQEDLQLVMRIDPLRAWQQQPKNGAVVDIRTATPLTWTEGDNASQHDVYFGSDAAAVAAADAADPAGAYRGRIVATGYTPSEDLAWGRKYFWRVDEVNNDGSITAGKVWSFTIADYLIVDDFESYTDEDGNRIYQTWFDGYGDGSSGSTVGNLVAPFAERTIIHSGSQALPMDYNNVNSPWFSEAERSWDKAQNWTFGGVDTLVVHFRGLGPAFLETAEGAITLTAAGTDIWGTADQCRYAFKRLIGDGSIVVRVDSIQNTYAWAKGGVMIRETLDPGSRHASVFVTPGSGVAFQRRLANNDISIGTTQAGIKAPRWVKLTRTGDTLTAQHSADGITWVDVGSSTTNLDTVVMSNPVCVGVVLTSHVANVAGTAQFSGIQTTGNISGSWQVAEIGADHPGNSPDKVYVRVEDSTGKTATVTYPDPAATLLTSWQAWPIDLASLTGVKAGAIKRLYVGVGDRKSPVPSGAGRLYIDDIRITRGVPTEPNAVP